jgi:hypothetical protein
MPPQSISIARPRQRAEDALRFYELGFRAIKIRFHHENPPDDLALAVAVVPLVPLAPRGLTLVAVFLDLPGRHMARTRGVE